MYHYTECGLPNIYVVDGYTKKTIDGEDYVGIDNVDALHKAIGKDLAIKNTPLIPAEFKFLRLELDLSQKKLAALLKCDEQTIARWEKGQTTIPPLADVVIRCVYMETIHEDSRLKKLLEKMVIENNEMKIEPLRYSENKKTHEWAAQVAA